MTHPILTAVEWHLLIAIDRGDSHNRSQFTYNEVSRKGVAQRVGGRFDGGRFQGGTWELTPLGKEMLEKLKAAAAENSAAQDAAPSRGKWRSPGKKK